MAQLSETKTLSQRLEDAAREIGTLLMAFAPLDAILTDAGRRGSVLLLLLFGALLFTGALFFEKRRRLVG